MNNQRDLNPIILTVLSTFLGVAAYTQARNLRNPHAPPCDLSAIEFPGDSFYRAESYFLGESKPLNPNMQLRSAVLSFGDPKDIANTEHPVYGIYMKMEFDATGVVNSWWKQVKSQEDVGCSSRTIWFPNPPWITDTAGAWTGRFHVKQVTRSCVGNAQIDLETKEIDYWNTVAVRIEPDGKSITPLTSRGASDNTSPILKTIAQGLGAVVQIVTLGFVPQAQVQAIDGHKAIEESLQLMESYEKGMLSDAKAANEKDVSGFTLDFLFADARFLNVDNVLVLSIMSSQNTSNLPNRGEACLIRKAMDEIKTGGENVGPEGTEYEVKSADSLWRLAERFYGNPKYHLILAGENNIELSNINKLYPGEKLILRPLGEVRKSSDFILVAKKDSLWSIASRDGRARSYGKLQNANRSWLPNPDLIYPLQVIRTPSAR